MNLFDYQMRNPVNGFSVFAAPCIRICSVGLPQGWETRSQPLSTPGLCKYDLWGSCMSVWVVS